MNDSLEAAVLFLMVVLILRIRALFACSKLSKTVLNILFQLPAFVLDVHDTIYLFYFELDVPESPASRVQGRIDFIELML